MVVVSMPVVRVAVPVAGGGPRPHQMDGALEGLERHLCAPAAQREAEPPAFPGLLERHREVGLEVPAEGAHHYGGTRVLRRCERDVAVVGGEHVAAAAPDGAVV